jgi:S1-C subfamily serine protease
VESIIGGNSPGRGFLGIQMQPVEAAMRGRPALAATTPSQGVIVRSVVAGAPADRAGLQPGDVITKVNGEAITSLHRAQRAIRLCKPGAACTIEYLRDGEARVANAQLDDAGAPLTTATPAVRHPTR